MSNPVSGGCAAVAIVVLAVGGIGCTSLRPLAYANAQGLAKEIKPHARLRIITVDGKKHHLRVTGVAGDAISGTERSSGRDSQIPLDKIKEIDRRVPAPGKTVGLAVGLGVLSYGLAYALAVVKFVSYLGG